MKASSYIKELASSYILHRAPRHEYVQYVYVSTACLLYACSKRTCVLYACSKRACQLCACTKRACLLYACTKHVWICFLDCTVYSSMNTQCIHQYEFLNYCPQHNTKCICKWLYFIINIWKTNLNEPIKPCEYSVQLHVSYSIHPSINFFNKFFFSVFTYT